MDNQSHIVQGRKIIFDDKVCTLVGCQRYEGHGEQVAPATVEKIEGIFQLAEFQLPGPIRWRTLFRRETLVISAESVLAMLDRS
jgi:hypothetical protein